MVEFDDGLCPARVVVVVAGAVVFRRVLCVGT